jgi:hypothetical protein
LKPERTYSTVVSVIKESAFNANSNFGQQFSKVGMLFFILFTSFFSWTIAGERFRITEPVYKFFILALRGRFSQTTAG